MILSLLILFPAVGFLINGLLHLMAVNSKRKISANVSGFIATAAMVASFGVALYQFLLLRNIPAEGRIFEQTLFNWISLGKLQLDFTLRLDSLSAVFCLVITGVGSLIHLYSIGYMHDDETPAKYFSYLNLFCFMMLNLVLGATLPHVFLGWEGVGLASYLLIGYWYRDLEKVAAGQKAFIMNRIGDLAFLLAMFLAFRATGTLDLLQLQKIGLEPALVLPFGLLIFFACTGKSAQIPLFTWLPDAMAGPTPVSALIHAATMVTSGIYLLTRLSSVISSSETVLMVIAMTGAVTVFLSALMACAQTDIKKVLAYSTISQLGFMFLGCGVGAFDAGVFHVMTHAFFKALLFLGAGSVIHALHGEQDIFKMGGLMKKLPITSWTFIMGWAAILGLPPFSGFFSKDEIIYQSLTSPHGSVSFFILAVAAAFLTAFYMTRLLVLVFFGPSRVDAKVAAKIHESPMLMAAPLIVLSILALVGGWLGAPVHVGAETTTESHAIEYAVMGGSVVMALIGAFIAHKKYGQTSKAEKVNSFLLNGMKWDSFYLCTFGTGTQKIATGINTFFEEMIVQRLIRWSAVAVDLSGNILKIAQSGSAQGYLAMMAIAIFAILAWVIYGVGQYGKL